MNRISNKLLWIAFALLAPAAASCGGSSNANVDTLTGSDASAPAGGSGGASGTGAGGAAGSVGGGTGGGVSCQLAGSTCSTNADCCSASCDPQMKICAATIGTCKAAGGSCTIPQDCCTFVCDNGACGATQCTTDNQACTTSAQCCSGACSTGGTCTPLSTACKTSGNACTAHAQCCSKVCSNGACAVGGSFCTQNGDACASDFECCGGLCTKAQGATLGLCKQPSAPGTTGCTVAGEVCGAGAAGDGGTVNASGLPTCGGNCCSRACAPYKTGVLICQPPSGCRPTGEICRGDSDCCGFGGVQGSTGVGNCSKANASDPVGRCDNGNACRPAGAICKLATMSCNAENNCCAGNVNKNPLVCQQDILGIPRCTMKGEACSDGGSKSGQVCATSADCCGLPCVPNPSFTVGGTGSAFVCGGVCSGTGATCSTGADCCPGLPCVTPPGSSRGTCGGSSNPPPTDAGVTHPPDGETPMDDGAVISVPDAGPPPGSCADYGQVCTTSADCCADVPCSSGRCVIIVN